MAYKLDGTLPEQAIAGSELIDIYGSKILPTARDALLSILPIVVGYILFQIFVLKQRVRKIIDISRGLLLTFLGLVIFLLGVNGGFMAVGTEIGIQLASMESKLPALIVALLLGLTTVLAEPRSTF